MTDNRPHTPSQGMPAGLGGAGRGPAPDFPAPQRPGGGGFRGGGMMGGRIEKAQNPKGAFLRLVKLLRPYRATLILVVGLVIVSDLLDLLGPYLVGLAIDRFISQGDKVGLARLSLFLLGTYLAGWGVQFGQSYTMISLTQQFLRGLRYQLFQHLQRLSLAFFDARPVGELMSRLTNDIDAIMRVLSQSVVELLASVLTVMGIVVVMFLLHPWLALGALVILPLMSLLTTAIGRRTRQGFRQVQGNLGQLNAFMEESITGAKVVQAFGRQKAAIAQFQQANIAVRDVSVRAQSLAMMLPPLLMILSNMDIVIIAGLGGWMALRGMISVGVIASFILYARRFFRPLMSLAEIYNSIQSALAGAERIFEVLDQKPQIQDSPTAIELDQVRGEVEFDNVSFEYVPGVPVLREVSFRATPGQTIALVGPTGAGKTTMVNLLSRFYDVTQGSIRIDGHDIRELKQDDLRRKLGIVLQDTFLFSDTVMENIRYGRLDATDEEVIAAAKLANADQFIQRLPNGYQTELSERASNLSQGQRQLLAIARAILADPRILILDEATSSVDTRTEVQIQQALLNLMKGRTSFVIAHRLSTIRKADLVLVINEGRIIERGTHESLMAQRGFYYHLYMSQFRRAPQPEAAQAPLVLAQGEGMAAEGGGN